MSIDLFRKSAWPALAAALALFASPGAAVAQNRGAPASSAKAPAAQGPAAQGPAAQPAAQPPAPAQPAPAGAPDEVTGWFKQAEAARDEGKFEEAAALLRKAWDRRKTWDIAGNLGLMERKLGQLVPAAEHLSFAVENLPPTADGDARAGLAKAFAAARAEVAAVRVRVSADGAEVIVAGESRGRSPLGGELFAPAGRVTVEVKKEGFEPMAKIVELQKGESREVAFDLKATQAPKPSWALLGAGAGLTAVALGAGIGLGAAAKGAQNEVEEKRAALTGPCSAQPAPGPCKEIADAAARHDAMVPASVGLLVTAGLLGAGTLIYGLWPRPMPVTASVGVGPQGTSVVISGSF